MKLRQFIRGDEGYTLMESVVAMTLFVGVLIPLVGIAGNFMVDRAADDLQRGLLMAQTGMNRTITAREFIDGALQIDRGLICSRNIKRSDGLVHVTISVVHQQNPSKTVVSLTKLVLAER